MNKISTGVAAWWALWITVALIVFILMILIITGLIVLTNGWVLAIIVPFGTLFLLFKWTPLGPWIDKKLSE